MFVNSPYDYVRLHHWAQRILITLSKAMLNFGLPSYSTNNYHGHLKSVMIMVGKEGRDVWMVYDYVLYVWMFFLFFLYFFLKEKA